MLRETDGSPLRGIEAFPILQNRDNAHKRAIRAIHPDRIGHQIELRPVFTRCRPPMRLVPVKHESSVEALFEDIPIHRGGRLGRALNNEMRRFDRFPTGTRKAILGRMNGVTRTLSRKEPNEKIDVIVLLRTQVVTKQELTRAKCFQNGWRKRQVLTLPVS